MAARNASYPAVKDYTVRLLAPSEGDGSKAYVVWREGRLHPEAAEKLHRWILRKLSTAERPVSVVFSCALPRNQISKLMDRAIIAP